MPSSNLEQTIARQINMAGLPTPEREFKFHHARKWRLDFAWPDFLIALEVEGGVWNKGRHTRPQGFENDVEKYNAATARGWSLYRATVSTINNGTALDTIAEAINQARRPS